MNIVERNRRAFSRQATRFSAAGDTYGDEKDLEWMLADVPLSTAMRALDVAAGTGELARALAAQVASVIALDATDAMRERGKRLLQRAGIRNVEFRCGVAEALPFEDDGFDIVGSRYAVHHFADAKPVLSEMVRVCKRGGCVAIVDIVAPEDGRATEYDYHEWLVDDSHTRSLGLGEIQTLFRLLGLQAIAAKSRRVESDVSSWLDFAHTPEERREALLQAIREELDGGRPTGLSPRSEGSRLYFSQTDAVVVGCKPVQ